MVRKRALTWVAAVVATVSASVPGVALADTNPEAQGTDGAVVELHWNNRAQVRNDDDGRTRSRVAYSFRYLRAQQLSAANEATALASCTGCRTVALALQVGIVTGRAPVVRADNRAVAVNTECSGCVTYASAGQFLLVTDEPLRLTLAGRGRLAAVSTRLRILAVSRTPVSDLEAQVAQLHAEVIEVLSNETRRAHRRGLLKIGRTDCDRRGRHFEARNLPVG